VQNMGWWWVDGAVADVLLLLITQVTNTSAIAQDGMR
jgi:hypothetical protein